ncbi:uncharacterized protein LOC108678015 isoform X2 [Hyalella azteca]|uniref:Phosphodiesterase n=1 Tax=Hyalella azteca TaxID=294128 RepID=A0A979FLI1_HYAAZ|nr:uncharacterized protein LOC108678015 isoform X2 [Hyalella azteca]
MGYGYSDGQCCDGDAGDGDSVENSARTALLFRSQDGEMTQMLINNSDNNLRGRKVTLVRNTSSADGNISFVCQSGLSGKEPPTHVCRPVSFTSVQRDGDDPFRFIDESARTSSEDLPSKQGLADSDFFKSGTQRTRMPLSSGGPTCKAGVPGRSCDDDVEIAVSVDAQDEGDHQVKCDVIRKHSSDTEGDNDEGESGTRKTSAGISSEVSDNATNAAEDETFCGAGRTYLCRLVRTVSRILFCWSSRSGKGCRVVSCGSSNSSSRSSSSRAYAAEQQAAAPAANVAVQQQSGLYITITPEAPSPLTVDCFSSTVSLDADASERLLPQPARAAARAAAADAGVGTAIVHRKFLTLHRRKKRKPAAPMAPHKALLDDLYPGPTQNVLERVGDWNFNAFALDSVTGGRPVSVLCVYLLHRYNLIHSFHMDTVTVWKCFSLIEEGYHTTNPYHNALHAADVTQAMHCYLQEEVIRQHMTPLETLAALLAAVCHDLDHPGVNQPFLIATDNHLAALYKNLSVLENHHWRCAMGCLWESGLLDGWALEDVDQLQDQIRSLILATDITRQQEFLTRFKKYQEGGGLDMTQPEDRHFSLQIALKCADICNPCRPWEVSQKWSQKICDEFYRQGDYERQLNLPVTALCDRYATSIAKIQTGFIEYVVSPLFGAWHEWLGTPLSSAMLHNLQSNLHEWKQRLAEDPLPKSPKPLLLNAPPLLTDSEEKSNVSIKEVVSSCSSSSSGDNPSEPVGDLFSQSAFCGQQTVVGRRHSLPLNVPSMLPRTVMRRESLSSDGKHPFLLETVHMEDMALSTLSQADNENADADMVSIVTRLSDTSDISPSKTRVMTGSCHPKSGRRRLSLPQLSAHQYRTKPPLVSLQPLPATPSVEELRVPSITPATVDGSTGGEGQGHSNQSNSESSNASKVSAECGSGGGVAKMNPSAVNFQTNMPDDVFRTIESSKCSIGDSFPANDAKLTSTHSISMRTNIDNSGNDFVSQLPDIFSSSSNHHYPARFLRRASLDSNTCTNINLNENLNLQYHRNDNQNAGLSFHSSGTQVPHEGKWPRRGSLAGDKENRAPSRGRAALLARTRYWRSLNHDDGTDAVSRSLLSKDIMQQVSQSPAALGRRGSAPVLQLDSLMNRTGYTAGDLKSDLSPDRNSSVLTARRASAPAQQLLIGIVDHLTAVARESSSLSHSTAPGSVQVPPSHPSELPPSVASRLGLDTNNRSCQSQAAALRGGMGGGGSGQPCYDPMRPRDAKDVDFSDNFGAAAADVLTNMYRFRHECGVSQESSDDMGDWYSSSGDDGTPSTPGYPFPNPARPFPHHYHHHHLSVRRGSLPCNFSFSGDLRLLETS